MSEQFRDESESIDSASTGDGGNHSNLQEYPTTIHDLEDEPKTEVNDDVSLQSLQSLQHIYTSGANSQYIHIGKQKFLRDDLYEAFGGTLNPGLAPVSHHNFGNPAPLGLAAFALTTFVLSLFNCKAQGVTIPNAIVGLAMFYGGLVQLIAGIWEIAVENTFGGTALCSFGGFWLSFGAVYIPFFGIQEAYVGHEDQLSQAMGFFLLGWAIFTFGLSLCTVKSTVMFFSLFFLLAVTFLLLSISEFTNSFNVQRAGGVVGVIVAFIAWYLSFAGIATKENSYIVVRPISLPTNSKTCLELHEL